jgi:hypothetical protein
VTPGRGRALRYGGKRFQTLTGSGFKANYCDVETGEQYWISGCHKDGRDALYSTTVEIDEDDSEEYWRTIRGRPDLVHVASFRAPPRSKSASAIARSARARPLEAAPPPDGRGGRAGQRALAPAGVRFQILRKGQTQTISRRN